MRYFTLLTLVFLFCGCNGSGMAPDVRTPSNFIVTLLTGGNIGVYAIDPNLGTLTAAPGSPFTCSASCSSAIADSRRNQLFAFDGTYAYGFSVNPTNGALTLTSKTSLTVGGSAILIPNLFLGFSVSNTANIYEYSYTASGLSQVSGSPFATTVNGMGHIFLDVLQRYLFVGTGGVTVIADFSIPTTAGAPSLISSLGLAGAPLNFAEDSTGTYIFNGESGGSGIIRTTVVSKSGALSTGPFYSGALGNCNMSIDQNNHFLFCYDDGGPQAIAFKLNNNGASLTQLATTPLTAPINNAILDYSGRFFYSTGTLLSSYAVDQTSGALTLTKAITPPTSTNQIYEFTFYR